MGVRSGLVLAKCRETQWTCFKSTLPPRHEFITTLSQMSSYSAFQCLWYQKKGASIVYEMAVKQIFDSFFSLQICYKQRKQRKEKLKKEGQSLQWCQTEQKEKRERNRRKELKERRRKVEKRKEGEKTSAVQPYTENVNGS